MVQPRAGRSRKVVESDEEEADHISKNGRAVGKRSQKRSDVITIASSPGSQTGFQSSASPSSQRSGTKPKPTSKQSKEATKGTATSKPIYSFFNAATQAERVLSGTPDPPQADPIPELEDIDDGPSDTERTLPLRSRPSLVATASRKRSSDGNWTKYTASNGSHKYFKANDGSRVRTVSATPAPVIEDDTRPWTEKYGPKSIEELVVHKKKVADVRQWLTESLGGHKHRRLLILKGSAGSGKTATLSTLSKALDFELSEWKNPAMADFGTDGYSSIASQFEDFLARGRRFGGLDIVGANYDSKSVPTKDDQPDNGKRKVLLIEEFPNNLQRTSTALQAFRATLLQYLSSAVYSTSASASLVLIISESVLSNSDSAEKFTAHRLLGAEILSHPSSTVIEFNTVAPTFISKALSLVLQKRSREVGKYYAPHPDVLKKLAEFGDVRNATSTLEFVCSQTSDDSSQAVVNSKVSKSRSSRRAGTARLSSTNEERDAAMSLVSLRESTVGLFHAVGKVVYNKRVVPNDGERHNAEVSMLPHLAHKIRHLRSEVEVDSLIGETGTDTQTFLSALHENFVLSTMPPSGNTEESLDSLTDCLDVLGDADVLSSLEHNYQGRGAGVGEALRQSDLAFHVGTRGLLLNLPHPVSRKAPPGRAKGSAFQMFYPSALKLWREKEEVKGLLDLLTHSMMSGALFEGIALQGPKIGTSISQPGRMPSRAEYRQTTPTNNDDANDCVSIGSGTSPWYEMLIERLPYLSHLLTNRTARGPPLLRRQIERITCFTGVRILQDEPDDDTSQIAFPAIPIRQKGSDRGLSFIGASTEDDIVAGDMTRQQQALADDDIEDD